MNSTYEEELKTHGSFIYTNVGTSMMPLLRQHMDLFLIEKKTSERCKKYDVVLYKRANGQYVLHRILKVRTKDYVYVVTISFTVNMGWSRIRYLV